MNTHKHSHPHTHQLFSKAYYLHFLNQIFGYKNLRFDNFKPTFGISYWEMIWREKNARKHCYDASRGIKSFSILNTIGV